METKHHEKLEPSRKNIELTFDKIQEFVIERGYVLKGELVVPKAGLFSSKPIKFDSKKQMKKIRDYISAIDRRVRMSTVNRFLHVLYKHMWKEANAPHVDYSDKEQKIRHARKQFKLKMAEALDLKDKYLKEKGDFYKKK